MNTVSWFLYIADIIGNVQGLLIAAAAISGLLIVFACIAQSASNDNRKYSTFERETPYVKWYYYLRFIWITILCAFLASVIPSKNTMYMIAASETGGMVLQNEQSKQMFDKIGEIINKKLDEALTEKKD